ncbi:phosphopantetheine-binding protein [Flavivirga jejuensis]|uniref:Phosphopantetheine-binding protein n=1 Tax=Flavivirga jejuensis TaxID=870487 RepID=A0ABT8WT48_9FLAO|nr:phosphopantetheine-binding protein [Flavivirga jejuensis]MDO5976357.1 phosphopantetheine-binding protein [Flavivirga jejuensis]
MEDILKLIADKTKPPIDKNAIKLEDELSCLGIDSLNFLLLILDLEVYAKKGAFKPENIVKLKTVGDIINKIEISKVNK